MNAGREILAKRGCTIIFFALEGLREDEEDTPAGVVGGDQRYHPVDPGAAGAAAQAAYGNAGPGAAAQPAYGNGGPGASTGSGGPAGNGGPTAAAPSSAGGPTAAGASGDAASTIFQQADADHEPEEQEQEQEVPPVAQQQVAVDRGQDGVVASAEDGVVPGGSSGAPIMTAGAETGAVETGGSLAGFGADPPPGGDAVSADAPQPPVGNGAVSADAPQPPVDGNSATEAGTVAADTSAAESIVPPPPPESHDVVMPPGPEGPAAPPSPTPLDPGHITRPPTMYHPFSSAFMLPGVAAAAAHMHPWFRDLLHNKYG